MGSASSGLAARTWSGTSWSSGSWRRTTSTPRATAATTHSDRPRDPRHRRAAGSAGGRGGARGGRSGRGPRRRRLRGGRRDAAAEPRAPQSRRPNRRPVLPRGRRRAGDGTARARRRGRLPLAGERPARGGWPRRPAPLRPRPRGRLGRDAGPAGTDHGLAVSRAGFVALAGRPNVGKSTLLNRLVGEKVAIVSNRPQTTRRAIRGIATHDDWQMVLVDLPGVQRPRDPLTERMQARMEHELGESDAALLVLNGEQGVGPGDRFIAEAIARAGVPAVVAVNKVDVLNRARTATALEGAAALALDAEIFPVSARTGAGVAEVVDEFVRLLPEGPFLYPPEEHTDLPT